MGKRQREKSLKVLQSDGITIWDSTMVSKASLKKTEVIILLGCK